MATSIMSKNTMVGTDTSPDTTRAPTPVSTLEHEKVIDTEAPKRAVSPAPAGHEKVQDEEKGSVVAEVPEAEYPTGMSLLFVVVALVLSIFLVALDMTIVATAIPKITAEFAGLDIVSWYGSAFFMAVGGFQSSWGKVYKYFPLKPSFLMAIFIFEVGSLICAVAPNSTALIVGRAIAGLGAAGLGSGAYTIIGFAAPPSKRPTYTGIVGASYGVSSVVGPLIGGVFSDRVTWRWCFYINLPIGALSAAIIFIFFHAPPQSKPAEASLKEKIVQLDLPGVGLVMSGIIAFILAMQYGGQTYAWNSSTVVGLLVGSVLIFAAFAVWQWWLNERAMLVPRILKQRMVWTGGLVAMLVAGSYFLMVYYLPIYFQSIQGADPTQSGVRNLPLIIAVTIATIASGILISVTGHAVPILVIGIAVGAVSAGLLFTLDIDSSSGKWIGYQVLAGLGYGFAFQVPVIAVQALSTPEDLAVATATVMFFQTTGGAFFVAAAQSAFLNTLIKKIAVYAPMVPAQLVLFTGAAEIHHVFQGDALAGVLRSYMDGIQTTYILATAGTTLAFFIACAMRWQKLDISAVKDAGGAA